MAIDPNYMTPNLRWGLFLKDHPNAPEPKFERTETDDSGVPADFLFDECGDPVQGFVKCTIWYEPNRVAATGWREIPTSEKLRNGSKKAFEKNAEAWQALCTMALGRALKRAGYPDTTVDLKAFLLYGQRLAEIAQITGGGLPAAAALGPGQIDKIVGDAAVGTPDADRPEVRPSDEPHPDPSARDDEPAEGEVVPPPGNGEESQAEQRPYPPSLVQAAEKLSEDGRKKLLEWLDSQGFTAEIVGARRAALNQAVAHANRLYLEEQETPGEDGTEKAEAGVAAS